MENLQLSPRQSENLLDYHAHLQLNEQNFQMQRLKQQNQYEIDKLEDEIQFIQNQNYATQQNNFMAFDILKALQKQLTAELDKNYPSSQQQQIQVQLTELNNIIEKTSNYFVGAEAIENPILKKQKQQLSSLESENYDLSQRYSQLEKKYIQLNYTEQDSIQKQNQQVLLQEIQDQSLKQIFYENQISNSNARQRCKQLYQNSFY